MSVRKKWYEYPRPIPFDELQQRRLQEQCFKDNKRMREWEKKNKAAKQSTEDSTKESLSREDQGTSEHVFPPTSIRDILIPTSEVAACPALDPHVVKAKDCTCEPASRFRKLQWPPKCTHVCARMGFDCWMC